MQKKSKKWGFWPFSWVRMDMISHILTESRSLFPPVIILSSLILLNCTSEVGSQSVKFLLAFQLSNSNIFDSTGDWYPDLVFAGDWYTNLVFTGNWFSNRVFTSAWLQRSYWLLLITRAIDYYWLHFLLLITIVYYSVITQLCKLFTIDTNSKIHPLKTSLTSPELDILYIHNERKR